MVSIWSVSLAVPQMYAYIFSSSESVTGWRNIIRRFLMGSIMFFVQMTLQNINVALGRANLPVTCGHPESYYFDSTLFVLTHFLGFKGVYMSEGIADLVAGIITAIVIFKTFPKIFQGA